MPIPFTEEAVRHVATRIRHVQDALGRRIAVENVSYYAAPFQAMDEAGFVNAVLDEAGCGLLLDVNNVYVNAVNHGYDATGFLRRMPAARIASYHVAGHYDEADDLKVDTHGAAVKDTVWDLLAFAYAARRAPHAAGTRLQLPALAGAAGRNRTHPRVAARSGCRCATRLPCLTRCAASSSPSRALRDPAAQPPPPSIEDLPRRLSRAFFNNIESSAAGNFPVIRKTPGDDVGAAGARVLPAPQLDALSPRSRARIHP